MPASACDSSRNCPETRSKRSINSGPSNRTYARAKPALAESLTQLVHGDAGLAAAIRATETFFGGKEIANFSDAELNAILADVPSIDVAWDLLDDGLPVADAFQQLALAASKGKARQAIKQGGAYVNNRRVSDEQAVLTRDDLASETMIVVRSGRKKYGVIRCRA